MGTSHSFAELNRKLAQSSDRIATTFPATLRSSVRIAAKEIKRQIDDDAPRGIHHVAKGRKPRKVGVRAPKVVIDDGGATGTGYLKPSGPVIWLEKGTPAHLVGTRQGKASNSYKRANRTFLKAGGYGHPVRGPIAHPGAKGKSTWSKGVDCGVVESRKHFTRTGLSEALKPFT